MSGSPGPQRRPRPRGGEGKEAIARGPPFRPALHALHALLVCIALFALHYLRLALFALHYLHTLHYLHCITCMHCIICMHCIGVFRPGPPSPLHAYLTLSRLTRRRELEALRQNPDFRQVLHPSRARPEQLPIGSPRPYGDWPVGFQRGVERLLRMAPSGWLGTPVGRRGAYLHRIQGLKGGGGRMRSQASPSP